MLELVRRRTRPVALIGAGAVLVALLPVTGGTAAAAPAAPAATIAGYAGDAYGTTVSVGSAVKSGQSSLITFGCGTQPGFHTQNTVASTALDTTLRTGTVTTTGDAVASPKQTVTSATTQNVSLLGGLVTAAAIRSVSTATLDGAGYGTSAAGTTFTTLKVLGVTVPLDAAPNTTIALPGIGSITVNEQIRAVAAGSATLTVNGLHVVVNQVNLLGLAVGTNIVVSHARSTLTAPKFGFLSGVAYGTQAKVGTVIGSGPSFPQPMPCTGTGGQLRTNTGVGVTVPGVLSSGTITDTANGVANATSATGQTTATVQSANLLGGLITATAVTAVATATKGGTVSDAGSTFGSITVDGRPLAVLDIAKNTKIIIPGVGTLILHRVIVTPNQIEVRMIDLTVTATTVAGAPLGTNVLVGVSRVAAR